MSFKKIAFFIVLSFWFNSLHASILSENAKISLITIAPGEDLYSSFGHSAFWVYDPKTGFDRIYNYGTFDFDEPNFYLKFIRGKLLYQLSISDMRRLLYGAQYEKRKVVEQVLNLDSTTKDNLFKFLEHNSLPGNRSYKYDFFFDNCATRERDALVKICGEALQFHLKAVDDKSFRQLLDPFLLNKQWQDLGMDIGLGMPADKIASAYDYMYLPEFLMKNFASATLQKGSHVIPLVSETKTIYEPSFTPDRSRGFSPVLFFWLLFGLIFILTIYQILKKDVKIYYLDSFFFVITGLLGLLLLFLWFGTDHYVTKNNWNLIWANPINLIVGFFLVRNAQLRLLRLYFLVYGVLTFLLLISWNLIPQELNFASLPFILMMSVRSLFIVYQYRPLNH